jgi:hypothetical protein
MRAFYLWASARSPRLGVKPLATSGLSCELLREDLDGDLGPSGACRVRDSRLQR